SRHLSELGLELLRDRFGPRTELGEERAHDALLLLEQRQQRVLRLDGLMVGLVGERLGRTDHFLRLHGQFVESHPRVPAFSFLSCSNSSFSRGDSGDPSTIPTRTNWSPAPPPLRCGIP